MAAGFWSGKKVFVTGHTGFKGSWLCLVLHRLGAAVHGYALPPATEPNLFGLAHIDKIVARHEIGDIRDREKLAASIRHFAPDIVMHLAAQPLLRLSYEIPVETYATNIMGTVHLLEAARQTDSVRVVVNVTSDKCYENRETARPYREEDPMGGFDPYSSSKGCAELITAAYGRSFFTHGGKALASVRAGNVIGGGDWARDRLVPDIVMALIDGARPVIRHPKAVRPWQHVLEPLTGYLQATEHLWKTMPRQPKAWNFGPAAKDEMNVAAIADEICRLWRNNRETGWETDATPAPHEAMTLKLDSGKARKELGWAPRWDLKTALAMTVEWYKKYRVGTDMQALTLEQIAAHQDVSVLAKERA